MKTKRRMYKRIAGVAAAFLLMLCCIVYADGQNDLLTLPVSVEVVEEEAFSNCGAEVVVITSGVQVIGERAFANCENLTDVVLPNHDVSISNNAFQGCGDILFHAFSGSKNELWVLSHGYRCESENADLLGQASAMLTKFGIPSSDLQSDNKNYATCRLIVKMSDKKLPDISAYEPTEIIQAGRNRFFIQFDGAENTRLCCEALLANKAENGVVWAEPDGYFTTMEPLVSSQGVAAGWDSDDPMNFGVYSAFVANESTGSIKIAVLDSGFPSNASYDSKLLSSAAKSFTLDGKSWKVDGFGHGKKVAAVIGECVGDANVKILPVKIADGAGRVDTMSLLLGLDYAQKQGVSLINLSIDYENTSFSSEAIEEAIRNCGATVVVSAGNFGNKHSRTEYFPARLSSVIAVGAVESNYQLSSYSCTNAHYVAPGSVTAGGFSDAGTSFSAPQITAALALLELDPYHGTEELIACCKSVSKSYYGMPQLGYLAQKSVVSVSIDNVPDRMLCDDFLLLQWSVLPRDATDKTVTCESSDSSVISVEANTSGVILVRAKEAGTAVLTVRSNSNPNVYTTKRVEVIRLTQKLTILGPSDGIIYMNQSITLTPVYTPEDVSIKALKWKSSDSTVMSVSEDGGVLTPKKVGTVKITAETTDGSGVTASIELTVKERPLVQSITIAVADDQPDAYVGGNQQLVATVESSLAKQEVKWESIFTDIAEIDSNGLVTYKKAGTAVICAVSTDGSGVRGYYRVTVNIPVSDVKLNTTSAELVVGEKITLKATVLPSDATTTTVAWTSNKTSVASVSKSGVVTAKGAGKATITVTADGGKKAECVVTVQAKTISLSTSSENDATPDGSEYTIDVTSNAGWTAVSDSEWLTITMDETSNVSELEGVKNATIKVTTQANTTSESRIGKITFTCGTETVTYTLKQWFYAISLNSNNTIGSDISLSKAEPDGGKYTIDGTATGKWTATSNSPWLTISADNESKVLTLNVSADPSNQGTTVQITAEKNITAAARTGKITFVCGTETATYTLTQAAHSISLSKTSLSGASYQGDSDSFNVTANGKWTAVSDSDWLSLSSTNGSTSKLVKVTCSANTGYKRTAHITFSCGSASASYTVTQTASLYEISFEPFEAVCDTVSILVYAGDQVGTLPTPTLDGYSFQGWYTAQNWKTQYTETTKMGIGNITLYACWTASPYTVTFNANGGSCSTASKSVTYASAYGTLPTPTRTGYSFDGWYTAASGGSCVYATTTYQTAGDTTLYAHWTSNSYTVTFDANGGSCSTGSKSVTYDSIYGTLPTPTRETYTFQGWYTASSGGNRVYADTVYTTANNTTLYAQWIRNSLSDWVASGSVPSNAVVEETAYSWTETIENTNTSMSGWTQSSSRWVQTSTGSQEYATFPSGFSTSHSIYTSTAKSVPYTASETTTTKRQVTNAFTGYIYWHWMYNCAYSANLARTVSTQNKVQSNGYAYAYFYAFKSATDYPNLYPNNSSTSYCYTPILPSYNCNAYVESLSSSLRNTGTSGLGTGRFFRFDYYTSTYKDYVKHFTYTRNRTLESTFSPYDGSTVSNKVTYVKYRLK